mmetsp:Transcript_13544/g.12021  ORF Transcript_13544/g.12021 Transcript_13544/m.12021 type:complete len:88 (-) Transcript_13544:60-323(-)
MEENNIHFDLVNAFLSTATGSDSDNEQQFIGNHGSNLTRGHLDVLVNLAHQRRRISLPENAQPGDRKRRGAILFKPAMMPSRVVQVG